MRKAALYGLAVVCVCLLFALSGPQAQKMVPGDGNGNTSSPVPVSVANFPATQEVRGVVEVGRTVNVTGSVAVTNLPAVQEVAGTVNVENLPVDATGRLLIALPSSGSDALTVRSTSATYTGDLGGRTGATQKCRAEFPNSHFPTEQELLNALNLRGIVWLSSETAWSWVDAQGRPTCFDWQATTNTDGSRLDGDLVRARGTDLFNPGSCSDAHQILCAE